MAERVALVVGAADLGEAVAHRLAADGCEPILCDPGDPGPAAARIAAARGGAEPATVRAAPADPDEFRTAVAAGLRAAGHDAVDVLVYTLLPADALLPRPLATLTEAEWHRLAEDPVRHGLTVLQVAHELLAPRRGRFVLVVPAIALEGAADLVPAATAAETLRALAKSAARRWAVDGITVNIVTPDVFAYGAEHLRGTDVDRGEAVLPGPSTARDVADAVSLLLAPAAARLTGTTLIVDGGALMTP
ncbi:SDR family oxidoreductase [Embleya sp. NBC_00888]|uniref:SDR family oxidoreductase n=1 Tax=Embleya sp. NBC_00888 TaxID=2975960 RepID=UPI00386835DE|nr:SDR family oxidoreductase [Embleya sp. NBC_00888]